MRLLRCARKDAGLTVVNFCDKPQYPQLSSVNLIPDAPHLMAPINKIRTSVHKKYTDSSRWVKFLLRGILVLIIVLFSGYFAIAWYVSHHKKEILASITAQLNENLAGRLDIGSMEPTLLQGFPGVSLNLGDVTIRDSLYARHGHLLLKARDFNISLNTLAMLRGAIEIKKISISNAAIDLFTDASGYSNTSVFRKSKTNPGESGGAYPELRKFSLENVTLGIQNLNRNKLFQFRIEHLKGDMNYNTAGWAAGIRLRTFVKSMAFNTSRGSFIKDRLVEGQLEAHYDAAKETIVLRPEKLSIGGEDFTVSAQFSVGKKASDFAIHIKNNSILWGRASALLSPNISAHLDAFSIKKPIAVTCDIVGQLDAPGDPLIDVKATVKDNTLETPGGTISECSFNGEFINNFHKGNGFNDANSAILFRDFIGNYAGIPVTLKDASILNLEHPIAKGDFRSAFDIKDINNIVDDDLLQFSNGKANVSLRFTADIVDYKLTRPIVEGQIEIKGAALKYVPRNLGFKDISVRLDFKDQNLAISGLHLKSGKSVVDMAGNISNFLNLYYTAPEKVVLNWQITSPQLYLGEFMGFLGPRKRDAPVKKKKAKGNFTEEINTLFEKSRVEMTLRVDKLFYNRFTATDVAADLQLGPAGIAVRNASLKHGGGTVRVDGTLTQKGALNRYAVNAVLSHVDISNFFRSFNNFGMQSLRAENLKGLVSAKAQITGTITDKGRMLPNSMYGTVDFNLHNGALVDFAPVNKVGKVAFPNRDLRIISFAELDGAFEIQGDKITIRPMQINSSVLNMDLQGVYSFGAGTEIYVDVPIRNPGRDKDIIDEEELAKRRNRGIVLHLVAADGSDGKVKVKLAGKRKGG